MCCGKVHLAPRVAITCFLVSLMTLPGLTCCSINISGQLYRCEGVWLTQEDKSTCEAAQCSFIIHSCGVQLEVLCQRHRVHTASSYLQCLQHENIRDILNFKAWKGQTRCRAYLLITCHSQRRPWGCHHILSKAKLTTVPVTNDKQVTRSLQVRQVR